MKKELQCAKCGDLFETDFSTDFLDEEYCDICQEEISKELWDMSGVGDNER